MTSAIELTGVIKDYRGLRPLRVESLRLAGGDRVAILDIDRPSAEVLINLITGTTLPDQGTVKVFGQSTADIRDSSEWMTVVDRFGILSERAVLLDALSAVQNLAIPFSLEVEPPAPDVRVRAEALAREVGLDAAAWNVRVGELDQTSRARVRLGRALALDPHVLLLEHPSAMVEPEAADLFGRQVRTTVERRGVAALTLTADREFAETVAKRVLKLNHATGRLADARTSWLWRLRLT